MDLVDYYDHDKQKLNCMIHSSGPERIYMANPQNGGDNMDNMDQRRDSENRARIETATAKRKMAAGERTTSANMTDTGDKKETTATVIKTKTQAAIREGMKRETLMMLEPKIRK